VPLVWHKVDLAYDRWLAAPLGLSVNGVIGVCDAAVTALGPVRSARLLGTVGPPVTLSPSLVSRPDPAQPTIGTLARLAPFKGHHHIVRAGALLAEEFPSLRVVLAGSPLDEYPEYPAELRALASELGFDGRLELPGFVRPEALLRELTVFVNATYMDAEGFGLEGLSGAILEASWAQVPVVATATGGTPEAVLDGETGTLVPDPDPSRLAGAIARYLRDPDLARRTGAAGRRFAQRFTPQAGAQHVFEMLAAAARTERPRA
jgi:glycosyltransferase involved in cell wall biosynthesis